MRSERASESLWPAAALWAPFYDDLAVLARGRGVEVILDGLGGDELLDAGIPAGRALRRRPLAFGRWLRAEGRYVSTARASARASLRRPGRPVLPSWLAPDPVLRAALEERLQAPPARLRGSPRGGSRRSTARRRPRDRPRRRLARLGLRRRSPLWDAEVVTLLDGLDPAQLVAGGMPKAPARAYLAGRVPAIAGAWPRPRVADTLYADLIEELTRRATKPLTELERLGILPRSRDAALFPKALLWTILSTELWLNAQSGRVDARA